MPEFSLLFSNKKIKKKRRKKVIIMVSLLLLITLALYIRSCSTQFSSITMLESLKYSLFGSCKTQPLAELATINFNDLLVNQFYTISVSIDESIKRQFSTVIPTYSRSNPKLGLGIVKGISMAQSWINQSTNSWQLAPEHPRNNKSNCIRVTSLSGENPVIIYEALKKNIESYLLVARHAVIHETGVVGLKCGYFQATESCETYFKFVGRNWWNKCKLYLQYDNRNDFKANFTCCSTKESKPSKIYDKVYVITASWDNNYHHFLIDSISRLIFDIEFLKQHTDIYIHIRTFEQYAKSDKYIEGGILLRKRIIDLLGLDEARFISGTIVANTVIIPRAVKCNYPLVHAYQLRKLSQYMIDRSKQQSTYHSFDVTSTYRSRQHHNSVSSSDNSDSRGKTAVVVRATTSVDSKTSQNAVKISSNSVKNIIIQRRACELVKECKKGWRDWSNEFFDEFQSQFQQIFPQDNIIPISSNNATWSHCLSCQIKAYQQTNVLVGLHGAGLTNMMFMPQNSIVVEIVGQFDGRMLPLCGYHGSLAAIFGIHHFIYYYDWKGGEMVNATSIALELDHFQKFLQNIN